MLSPEVTNAIQRFSATLEGKKYAYDQQELCRFLLDPYCVPDPTTHEKVPYTWKDKSELLEYIRDYFTLLKQGHEFHKKWTPLREMKYVTEVDEELIPRLEQLIQAINAA